MKNRLGIVILILICAGLSVALIWNQLEAARQHSVDADSIGSYSNKWADADVRLKQLTLVKEDLEADREQHRAVLVTLTNANTELTAQLERTEASLKTAEGEIARRDTRIADLESQNLALDQRALDLSIAMTNLNGQIDDTRKRLAASEGDKAFLESELQRLIAEKSELERQFNDLAVLRAQVAKLREELNVSRRLQWIRDGLFARADQKGAQQLMAKSSPIPSRPARQRDYDLNVEVSADGTVRVVPPLGHSAAGTNASARPAAE